MSLAGLYLGAMIDNNIIFPPAVKPKKIMSRVLTRRRPRSFDELFVYDVVYVRHKRRMKQAELARLAKVSRRTISSIETGKSVPNLVLALRIAHILGEPVEKLFKLRFS